MTPDSSETWPGLQIKGASDLLDQAETLACELFDDDVLLGTARTTWHDPKFIHASGEPGAAELGALQIYLSQTADVADCAQRLESALHAASSEVAASPWTLAPLVTPHADWATQWKAFYRPVAISERLRIEPAWWGAEHVKSVPTPGGEAPLVVRIEPGQAFGSGTHATTRVCLRLMDSVLRPGMRVLDFGAGSGILAFAAGALKASEVVAVEIDPETRENFEENLRLNQSLIGDTVMDHRIGSSETLREGEMFDLILCNSLFHRVSDHLPIIARYLKPDGIFVYSGFLVEEREQILDFFTRRMDMRVETERDEEEWGGLVCRFANA
ncbi:MAG TPA: 50S ribosomal protein L11 methyltransferase [Candidatus Sumerlaeota bacterium]|nr:50S ribosomal protein L11 methyltransferase [Candidatus Sumerlaeota bacterium]